MDHQTWLQDFLARHGAVAGSVHLLKEGALHLSATHNIPPVVQAAVKLVPEGKGMAGLALQRREPVQTCNLQGADSPDVKPGARAVNARAAIAFPVMNDNAGVWAVVGMAWMDERQITEQQGRAFMEAARDLPG